MTEENSVEESTAANATKAKVPTIVWVGLGFVVIGLLMGVNKGSSFFAWIFLIPGFVVSLVALAKSKGSQKLALVGLIGSVLVFFIAVGVSVSSLSSGSSSVSEAASSAAAEDTPAETTTPEPATPTVPTKVFKGSGDSVIKFELSDPAILTFICNGCTSNTVLKTDGRDSLLVNEIGAYAGSRIVNTSDGSLITKFEINADADWQLTVADVTTAKKFTGPASGHGDTVLLFTNSFDTATIKNVGESNFVVYGYGGSLPDLAVNEIGSYKGTVSLKAPGFVQVESSGDWSITPQ